MNTKRPSDELRISSGIAQWLMLAAFILNVVIAKNCPATTPAYRPAAGICGAAVDGDLKKVVSYLQADPKMLSERDSGRTPLHWASEYGRTNVVDYLLRHGADTKLADDRGATPLHSAAFFGHGGVVRSLLDHGADPMAAAKGGYSVLLSACCGWPKTEIIELLIGAGVDPNVSSDDGVTPLQKLSFRESPEILKLLLAAGADVNQIGWERTTAIHWAMDGNNVAAALLLAKHGADGNARNKDGITALARARVKLALGGNYSMRQQWAQVAKSLASNFKGTKPTVEPPSESTKPAPKFNRRHKNT